MVTDRSAAEGEGSTENGTGLSNLDAAEAILSRTGKPMHARALARAIVEAGLASLRGNTPWKTITARISEDIINKGVDSKFLRAAHGTFALRSWKNVVEFGVKRRKINPVDEIILAVPRELFLSQANDEIFPGLYNIQFQKLINISVEIKRSNAEETEDYVQLVPTFIVRNHDQIYTFVRTKRLPEARLHHARCTLFGGHMQASDAPELFRDEISIEKDFIFRELNEELLISGPYLSNFIGVIYLKGNTFERQHAGIVFDILLGENVELRSLEPGMHGDVRAISLDELMRDRHHFDSWSRLGIEVIRERV